MYQYSSTRQGGEVFLICELYILRIPRKSSQISQAFLSYVRTMENKYLLLFGDQTVDSYLTIKQLARKSKDSPSLQLFFQKTVDVLQYHIGKLQIAERERFFSFDSIIGLAEAHARSGVNDVVVSTILLCIAQLATLIM